ncbi:MAG: radical SAM protein [Desulfobacterales bacterium]
MTPETLPGLFLDLALTNRCPLRCRFCSVSREAVPELPAAAWAGLVDALAREVPLRLVSLEGGEPLIRGDLPEILEACLERAEAVKVVSGGSLPLSRIPPALRRDPRFLLEVSLDGPPPIHDGLRDGSYRAARRFLEQALEDGVRVRVRSVVSAVNRDALRPWLAALDREIAAHGRPVGFRFDALVDPARLERTGGPRSRLGTRRLPRGDLVPAPRELFELYAALRRGAFAALRLEQPEALRGCGAAKLPAASFDPAGGFSLCCEAPGGFGFLAELTPAGCLRRIERAWRRLPCRRCPHFAAARCEGCWTGRKCGLAPSTRRRGCRALFSPPTGMAQDDSPGTIDLPAETS